MATLSGLARRLLANRRRAYRKRLRHDAVVKDAQGRVVFRGKTIEMSQTGIRLVGSPGVVEPAVGLRVTVECLALGQKMKWLNMKAVIRRFRADEAEAGFILGLQFTSD
jgi:hypothetical protein